jgi:hypothetical protein
LPARGRGLEFFQRWHSRATHSQLKPLVATLTRRLPTNLLSAIRHWIATPACDDVNAVIQ